MNTNFLIKVLVVGNPSVGKTCCIRKLVYNTFGTEYKTTIGVDFAFKPVKFNYNGEDVTIRVQLWDIAGQERHGNLVRAYFKDAYGCLIVGDLELETIKSDVEAWKTDLDGKVMFPNSTEKVPCVLLCNKIDKPQARENFTDMLKNELSLLGFDCIYGTSAQSGENLAEALEFLCRKILQKIELYKPNEKKPDAGVVKTDDDEKKPNFFKQCC